DANVEGTAIMPLVELVHLLEKAFRLLLESLSELFDLRLEGTHNLLSPLCSSSQPDGERKQSDTDAHGESNDGPTEAATERLREIRQYGAQGIIHGKRRGRLH